MNNSKFNFKLPLIYLKQNEINTLKKIQMKEALKRYQQLSNDQLMLSEKKYFNRYNQNKCINSNINNENYKKENKRIINKSVIETNGKMNSSKDEDVATYDEYFSNQFEFKHLCKIPTTFIEQKPHIFRKKPKRSDLIESEANKSYEILLNHIEDETKKMNGLIKVKTIEDNLRNKFFESKRRKQEEELQNFLIDQIEQKVLFTKKKIELKEKKDRLNPLNVDFLPDNEDPNHLNYEKMNQEKRNNYQKELKKQVEVE